MSGLKRSKHLFKKSDFSSNQCVVVMRNITTSTDLKKGQTAELTEVAEQSLVLLLPEGTCSEGHLLLLRFFDEESYAKVRNSPRSVQDRAQFLAITGRVLKASSAISGKSLVTVELQQYVEKEWKALTKTFKEAQKEVSALVKRIKD